MRQELSQTLGRKPTKQELAIALNLEEHKLDDLLTANQNTLSLHTSVGQDEDTELMHLMEDADNIAPGTDLERQLLINQIEKVLADLRDREREVIKLRFGLTDGQVHPLEEIAQLYNLSRERVRQIQAKAMRKLRHPRRQTLLKDWVD